MKLLLKPQGQPRVERLLELDFARVSPDSDYWTARGRLDGLESDTRYSVQEVRSGAPKVAAMFRTLPGRLPNPSSGSGLSLLLGSCFSIETGKGARLGDAVRSLSADLFPHVKLLCGDQVYLDLPVTEDLPQSLPKLRRKLLRKYLDNWHHDMTPLGNGFGAFLSLGSNVFTADDHEFWNNFPVKQAHLPITWRPTGRRRYEQAAKELFRCFQSDYQPDPETGVAGVQSVTIGEPGEVGSFELKALDGRFFRDSDFDRAHLEEDLDHVVDWLENLKQPGALVLSQPLFDEPAGWLRRKFVDAWLANYKDYAPLVKALNRAPHDVLLLSGDIHHARYAVARGSSSRGNALHEVVSSPLSRIPGKHGYGPAHKRFPDPDVRGVTSRGVRTRLRGAFCKDHFATLKLNSLGCSVQVSVTYWGMDSATGAAIRPEAERRFTLNYTI